MKTGNKEERDKWKRQGEKKKERRKEKTGKEKRKREDGREGKMTPKRSTNNNHRKPNKVFRQKRLT